MDGWMEGNQESDEAASGAMRASGHCLVGELPRRASDAPYLLGATAGRDAVLRLRPGERGSCRGRNRARRLPWAWGCNTSESRRGRRGDDETAVSRAGQCGTVDLPALGRLSPSEICNRHHVARAGILHAGRASHEASPWSTSSFSARWWSQRAELCVVSKPGRICVERVCVRPTPTYVNDAASLFKGSTSLSDDEANDDDDAMAS
ncbi:hypothetical protein JDV02_003829 [Purpureocillium takamizusanense]|uniref:Uncharacterized protein n=1 Tax=Purpureocillium takamizusanense TaxID=2060973 RepID=A0A9Q8QEI5_9HYPO|nr:uncharacterized protein JDV02_003829 [Purpureocillium takamizusanense]UNI17489.1 hypothetical protein JDV02_003829 [Purpureocillium takamizusanense]